MYILITVLAILAIIALWAVLVFNGLISLRNRTQEAWSDIDVQLKRRYNLIPNLMETVKGYARHEEGVFQKVTEARARAIGAGNVKEQAQAENQLTGALKTLFAVAESYPDLKASANFVELQRELRDTEDKIQASRRFYNGNVRDLNTKIETFPNSAIANLFNFKKMEFFELEDEAARAVPKVQF